MTPGNRSYLFSICMLLIGSACLFGIILSSKYQLIFLVASALLASLLFLPFKFLTLSYIFLSIVLPEGWGIEKTYYIYGFALEYHDIIYFLVLGAFLRDLFLKRINFSFDRKLVPIVLFLSFVFVSFAVSLYSGNVSWSLFDIARKTALYLMAIFMYNSTLARDPMALYMTIVSSTTVYCLFIVDILIREASSVFFQVVPSFLFSSGRVGFANSDVLPISVIILLQIVLRYTPGSPGSKSALQLLAIGIIGLHVFIIGCSQFRSIWFAFLFCIAIFVIIKFTILKHIAFFKTVLLLVFVSLVAIVILNVEPDYTIQKMIERIQSLVDLRSDDSLNARLYDYYLLLEKIVHERALLVGLGLHFSWYVPRMYQYMNFVDNLYITIIAITGSLGLLIYVSIIFSFGLSLLYVLRNHNTLTENVSFQLPILSSALVLFSLLSFFNAHLFTARSSIVCFASLFANTLMTAKHVKVSQESIR